MSNHLLTLDAVVLAGTHRNPKRLIQDQNKAFLMLKNRPLVSYVVQACLESRRLDRVVVVGPRNELEQALADLKTDYPERLILVQQRSRVLENVWNGFLATFPDGNNLPINRKIDTLLLAGHIPIKKRVHLHIIHSVYAAVAGQMERLQKRKLHRGSVMAIMERRFDAFRFRFEQQEWFMGKMGIETLLAEGHVLCETGDGIVFRDDSLYRFFVDWENRFKKSIFVTGCDIPLLTAAAVDDFIDRSTLYEGDFFVGVSSADTLKHFSNGPNGSPGIQRPYLSFREAELRAANLIVVAPNRVGNKELIQESFGVRKMTEWHNVIAVAWKLLRLSGRFQTIRMVIMLQAVAVLKRHGMDRLAGNLQRFIRIPEFERLLSRIFMTQLRLIETPYSAASLDVDEPQDYERLCDNFEYWQDVQRRIIDAISMLQASDVQPIGGFGGLEKRHTTRQPDFQ
ncbi:NTP transferase domain-containing protein [bacterium]|nr:NTP transferase domain-containing protein [candidate division CSSED10-310 bacterium]